MQRQSSVAKRRPVEQAAALLAREALLAGVDFSLQASRHSINPPWAPKPTELARFMDGRLGASLLPLKFAT